MIELILLTIIYSTEEVKIVCTFDIDLPSTRDKICHCGGNSIAEGCIDAIVCYGSKRLHLENI